MTEDEEERRRRAYAIWEREGRPEGRHADHWDRAARQDGDTPLGQPGTPPEGAPRRTRPGTVPGPNAGSRATNRSRRPG